MTDGSAESGVDFALAAYREDGAWQVEQLPPQVAGDLEALLTVVRQRPGDGGALGLVSVDEDFFVAVRVAGGDTRLLLSDVTAAVDSPL
ncbi:MAG: tRNA adenosine deaminase-associated protein, partial [Jiangellaceae bacterium]